MNRRELERYVDSYINRLDLPTMINRHKQRKNKNLTISLMNFENSVVARQLLQQQLTQKGYTVEIKHVKDHVMNQPYHACVIKLA